MSLPANALPRLTVARNAFQIASSTLLFQIAHDFPLPAPQARGPPSSPQHAPPGGTEAGTRHPGDRDRGGSPGGRAGPVPLLRQRAGPVPLLRQWRAGPVPLLRQIRLRCSGSSTGATDPTPARQIRHGSGGSDSGDGPHLLFSGSPPLPSAGSEGRAPAALSSPSAGATP